MRSNRYYTFKCPLCDKETTSILDEAKEIKKCDKCKGHFIAELIITTKIVLAKIADGWVKEIQV
jgi:ribosomal protein L37AE/L43A